jgi:hypothetical protein
MLLVQVQIPALVHRWNVQRVVQLSEATAALDRFVRIAAKLGSSQGSLIGLSEVLWVASAAYRYGISKTASK